MNPETKNPYISPTCEVLEIKPEGIIADSSFPDPIDED
jgi:hypothetical protein